MSPVHLRQTPRNCLLLVVLGLSRIASASLSLQQLQPIAKFPAACEAAYQTLIPSCPDASSFSPTGASTGSPVCTTDCLIALTHAAANIQTACRGTAAPPGTVIAHAFSGDLAYFLCGTNPVSSSEPSGNPNPTTSASSATVSGSTSGSTTIQSAASTLQTSTKQGESKTNTPSPSSTNTQNSVSTSTASSVSSSSTDATSHTSTITSLTTSKSSTSSSSSSKKPEPTLNPGGGGSPFDQTVPNAAPTPVYGQNNQMMSLVVGVAFVVAIGS